MAKVFYAQISKTKVLVGFFLCLFGINFAIDFKLTYCRDLVLNFSTYVAHD